MASTTNVVVTHADSGVIQAEVVRSERISPSFVRVTLGGDDLARFHYQGFDQWFRLAVPTGSDARFDNLPSRYGIGGYLKYSTLPKSTRPAIRNYTVRAFRSDPLELDIDFVVHGDAGIAGPWAATVEPGAPIAFIDQGMGWKSISGDSYLLVADETGLPAVAGILRDLPRDAIGHAVIELPDAADAQPTDAPDGVTVHWPVRGSGRPGALALETVRRLQATSTTSVFAVGEAQLATGVRRWAIEQGVPKTNIVFCGYWRAATEAH